MLLSLESLEDTTGNEVHFSACDVPSYHVTSTKPLCQGLACIL